MMSFLYNASCKFACACQFRATALCGATDEPATRELGTPGLDVPLTYSSSSSRLRCNAASALAPSIKPCPASTNESVLDEPVTSAAATAPSLAAATVEDADVAAVEEGVFVATRGL